LTRNPSCDDIGFRASDSLKDQFDGHLSCVTKDEPRLGKVTHKGFGGRLVNVKAQDGFEASPFKADTKSARSRKKDPFVCYLIWTLGM
jgi:hypothetical protein